MNSKDVAKLFSFRKVYEIPQLSHERFCREGFGRLFCFVVLHAASVSAMFSSQLTDSYTHRTVNYDRRTPGRSFAALRLLVVTRARSRGILWQVIVALL